MQENKAPLWGMATRIWSAIRQAILNRQPTPWPGGGSRRRVTQFLKKEIKTYKALALFLSRRVATKNKPVIDDHRIILPAYYKERMREADSLVSELERPKGP